MKYVYPACFYPQEDGTIIVEIPNMDCSVHAGCTIVEAIEAAADCAAGWIVKELESGNKLPKPSRIDGLTLKDPSGVMSLVYIDMDRLQANHDAKPVEKAVFLPSFLSVAAEKNNIDLSATLEEALQVKLKNTK